MSLEIEAKMQLLDKPTLQARLRDLGALNKSLALEINTFFDTPQATLKSLDQGLRIRAETNLNTNLQTVTITHKGPRLQGHLKTREETEIVVSDAAQAAKLLEALGYHLVFSFEKQRETWSLDNCLVVLDTLPYIDEFVEIEGPTDSAVMATREKLNLTSSPLINTSYIALLTDHLAKHHIKATHVRMTDSIK